VDAPRDPNDSPARRTSVRRTTWLLGAVAFGLYVYAMFKIVSHGDGA
jgi:hypothetical protein